MSHEDERPDKTSDIEPEDARDQNPGEVPQTDEADAHRTRGGRGLVLAAVAGAAVALALVGGVSFVAHLRGNNSDSAAAPSSSPRTMQQAMADLGCANPQPWESTPGIGTGFYCNGSRTDTVFFFESKQAESSWLLRIQGTASAQFLVVGPGWYVGTYSSDMAATAIGQGGQQVN